MSSEVAGLCATTIMRVVRIWLQENRLACLAITGIPPDSQHEVTEPKEGYRESTELRASVLRGWKKRGGAAAFLVVGGRNPGMWAALRVVHWQAQGQRRWQHRITNLLDKLPKRPRVRAKELLREIVHAPDRQTALEGVVVFSEERGARYPKAVETLTKDQDRLLTFFAPCFTLGSSAHTKPARMDTRHCQGSDAKDK